MNKNVSLGFKLTDRVALELMLGLWVSSNEQNPILMFESSLAHIEFNLKKSQVNNIVLGLDI